MIVMPLTTAFARPESAAAKREACNDPDARPRFLVGLSGHHSPETERAHRPPLREFVRARASMAENAIKPYTGAWGPPIRTAEWSAVTGMTENEPSWPDMAARTLLAVSCYRLDCSVTAIHDKWIESCFSDTEISKDAETIPDPGRSSRGA
jgi:hypothetical protein